MFASCSFFLSHSYSHYCVRLFLMLPIALFLSLITFSHFHMYVYKFKMLYRAFGSPTSFTLQVNRTTNNNIWYWRKYKYRYTRMECIVCFNIKIEAIAFFHCEFICRLCNMRLASCSGNVCVWFVHSNVWRQKKTVSESTIYESVYSCTEHTHDKTKT